MNGTIFVATLFYGADRQTGKQTGRQETAESRFSLTLIRLKEKQEMDKLTREERYVNCVGSISGHIN